MFGNAIKDKIYRNSDEDEYAYIYRICSLKDVIGTWEDVADILNKELGYEYTESKYRKQYQSFLKMFEANQSKLIDDSNDITEQILELKKEREKFRTEKLEYNKWLREQSRDEMIMEQISEAIRNLPDINISRKFSDTSTIFSSDEEAIVGILCYGDEHYGSEFVIEGFDGKVINQYSPDIFESRMEKLLKETIQKVRQYGLKILKVYSLGDELDGILRVSQLMKLKYGVVESAIRYSEFISKWLSALSEYVDIEFHMAEGNHTELRMLGQPKGTFADDNMSKIIKEYIKVRTENNKHFVLVDTGSYIFDTVFSMNIMAVHGEIKNIRDALKNYSVMYGMPIDILICGHKHHNMSETVGIGKDIVCIPSIMGTNPYSERIMRTADAGASFLIVSETSGLTTQHNIKFTE